MSMYKKNNLLKVNPLFTNKSPWIGLDSYLDK